MKLTMDQLKEKAPAIFAEGQSRKLSNRYQRVSTLEAIKTLMKEGWVPVAADQKRSRVKAESPYAKHLVRLRHESAKGIFEGGAAAVGQAFPEIVLTNSHNGTSCYRLMAGIHVLACSNGLIVAEETLSSKVIRHISAHQLQLVEAAKAISEQITPVVAKLNLMRKTKLKEEQKLSFAKSALKLKFPAGGSPLKAKDLLTPRRDSDKRDDLWAVFNVVQENVMAGGLLGKTTTGRQFTSLPVRDINVKIKKNQQLWALAEEFLTSVN